MSKVHFDLEVEFDGQHVTDMQIAGGLDETATAAAAVMAYQLSQAVTPRGVWPHQRLRKWALDGGVTRANGDPFQAKVGPASIDLHLTGLLRRPRWYWRNPFTRWLAWHLRPEWRDMKDKKNEYVHWGREERFTDHTLWPGESLLLSSIEYFRVPDDALAITRLRSTSGRNGPESMDAGIFDPGWWGCGTFEVFNPYPWPVYVSATKSIIQVIYFDLSEKTDSPYVGRYQGQGEVPVSAREELVP